jgi:hypothetical protein
MFTTADWTYATAVWTPHFLKGYQAELYRDLEEDRAALSLPAFRPARRLSIGEPVEEIIQTGARVLVLFFTFNLIAWLFGWMCDSALLIRRRYRRLV